ncbi:MAG: hypothetical protein WA213_10170 [Terriglobales bacterium]
MTEAIFSFDGKHKGLGGWKDPFATCIVTVAAKAATENKAVIAALSAAPPKIECKVEFFSSLLGLDIRLAGAS